ncbi:MAG: hypothetical protein PVI22_17835, partial [Lysobacterales bacterium]
MFKYVSLHILCLLAIPTLLFAAPCRTVCKGGDCTTDCPSEMPNVPPEAPLIGGDSTMGDGTAKSNIPPIPGNGLYVA